MRRPAGRKRLIATGAVLAALATGAVWYARTYPPTLAGVYVGQINDSPDSQALLTLRPGGHGYLKLFHDPEAQITWKVDGDRIAIQGDNHGIAVARRISGKDIDLDVNVDPAIIGGLIVKVGSRMVDSSLRTNLNAIKIAMKEAR